MRILFITATRIGDGVLSTGVLAHLIENHPQARITVAAGPAAAPLFEAAPRLERLVVLRKRPWGLHWLKLWGWCVLRPWSLVVDLRRTGLSYLIPTARRMIPDKNREGVHRVRILAEAMRLTRPPAPRLWTAPRHQDAAAKSIPEGSPVLAVAPVANWRGKTWRAERFAETVERLTAPGGILPDARVAVLSAPDEREAALPVLETVPPARRIDLAGTADLLTGYACLARCALFIGNDSALMHLAAAAGIPTLGLFGPSKDRHYAPWGPHAAVVRTAKSYDELVGGPGYDHKTTGTLMDSLSVDAVVAAAETLWRHRQEPGPIVRPKLSALVVAHNEEAQLEDCLATLRFADEIVVVLDKCTDGSKAIAERAADTVIEGSWEIEGPRRMAGIEACSGEWILEVDADERVPEALAQEIRDRIPGAAPGHFLIPYDNYVGDRLVKYGWGGSWGVSSTARLFAKGCKVWRPQRIHPKVELRGEKGRLTNAMVHYVDRDVGDMIRRLDRYTAARARDLRDAGMPESFGRNLRRLFTRFFKCYVRRKGWREGYYGFLIALMAGLYPMVSWLRARLEET